MSSTPADPAPWGPYAEAIEHGIEVVTTALDTVHSIWVPAIGMIVVNEDMPEASRRAAIGHQLVHAEFDTLGYLGQMADEATICMATARRMIPKKVLRWALEQSDDAEQVADILDVPLLLLGHRIHGLTPLERRRLGLLVDRIWWGGATFAPMRCGRVDHWAELHSAPMPGVTFDSDGDDGYAATGAMPVLDLG